MEPFGLKFNLHGSALAKSLAWIFIALFIAACKPGNPDPIPPGETEIGYRFLFNSTDSTATESGLAHNQLNWLDRLTDSSQVLVWQPQIPNWLDSLCGKISRFKGLKIRLILPDTAAIPPCLASQAQNLVELGQIPAQGSLPFGLVIARNFAAKGRDDGRFHISFHNYSASKVDSLQSELLEVYGDSSLVNRYEAHFLEAISAQQNHAISQTRTYSNVHDHMAWFFPASIEPEPFAEMLDQLDQGIIAKRYPARMRLALTDWNPCKMKVARQLVSMQAIHELDLRILLPDSSSISAIVGNRLADLPKGMFRIFSGGSAEKWRFSSNMLLIHGPYIMAKGALPERQSLTFLLPGGLQDGNLVSTYGAWIRIADEDVFQKAELHFDQMWELASDSIGGPRQWNTTNSGCKF